VLAALLRPAAGLLPDYTMEFYSGAGFFWIAAFTLFVFEYGPMLARVRRVAIG
jgi:uncharacterized protein involved in response to NO